VNVTKLRAGLALAIGLGVAVSLIVTLATGGRAVISGMLRLPAGWLVLALALSALSWMGQGLGFAALSRRPITGNLLSMTTAFLGGDFGAFVTPFGSGGIPLGVYCLTREGLSAGEASAVIAMHTLLTGAFFLLAGVIALVVTPLATQGAGPLVWMGMAAFALALTLLVWVALRPKAATAWISGFAARPWSSRLLGEERALRLVAAVERELEHFIRDLHCLMRARPGRVALSFLGLAGSRACLILCLPVIMYGLGWRGHLLPLLATATGALALAIISPTPGGSGAVEAATAALLATQGPVALAGAATLLYRGVTYYAELLAGWAAFTHYLTRSGRVPDTR